MHERYQILLENYADKNNVLEEYDDVELVKFFNKIKAQYSPRTLWVIYSCINAGFIDRYGKNLKGLVHLQKFLKLETNKFVAKKSKMSMAEEVHQVLKTLNAMNTPNTTSQVASIALLYYGLLRANDVKNLQADDVVLSEEKKMILVTFKHQCNEEMKDLCTMYLMISFLCLNIT